MMRAIGFILFFLTLTGCETTKGAGQDIKNVGNAITGAASDVQDAL